MSVFSRQQLVVALAFGTAALAASPAVAQEAETNTLSLKVQVASSCSINGSTLDFGTYTNNQPGNLDAEGSLTVVDCPAGTVVRLDGGGGGNINQRRMSGPDERILNYNLYNGAGRTGIWGDGTTGDALTYTGTAMTVYGRIPGGQTAALGAYTDTVNITLVLQ